MVPACGWQRAMVLALLAACIDASAWAQTSSPVGRWRTYDDTGAELKSIVVIRDVNGEMQGYVEKVFAPPAPSERPLCERCTGDRKNRPVVGMQIMWGMKKDGSAFTGGRLFDPEAGREYRGKIRVVDGGRRLEVRGFIGLAMFGRTQVWIREP